MSVIKVEGIAFARFQAPDLGQMRQFLKDFGLKCFEQDGKLYARGTDGAPFVHVTQRGEARFLGLGFCARSRADLDILAKQERVLVEASDAPGGGIVVHLSDPDGFSVEVVAEQNCDSPGPLSPENLCNSIREHRRISEPVRLEHTPSHVHRLGHAMIMVSNFTKSAQWYRETLGLIVSDQVEVEPGSPVGAFMRLDRGSTPTDHHTIAILERPEGPGFSHVAFEVEGFDDLMKGHTYLKERNHKHAWGIGRHKMGSHIFDYWKDPWGHEFEHWTDGDLCVADDGMGTGSIEDLLGTQWGPRHHLLSGTV